MRFLTLVTTTNNPGAPPPAMVEAIEKAMMEGMKNKMVLDGGELGGASVSRVFRLKGGKVTDGPYAEAKEVAGGYAILEYASHESALKGSREWMEMHATHWPAWEGTVQLLPIVAHR